MYTVAVEIGKIDMTANPAKSVCMVFAPKKRNNIVSAVFPRLNISGEPIEYVNNFKYLGHKIVNSNTDDADIQRELSNLFVRTNILLRRFGKCSEIVKVALFKAYCLCLYDTALWKRYKVITISKLRSGYNKCIKIFFGFSRRDSMTNVLLQLGLPSFDTIINKGSFSFRRQSTMCNNRLVKHLMLVTGC